MSVSMELVVAKMDGAERIVVQKFAQTTAMIMELVKMVFAIVSQDTQVSSVKVEFVPMTVMEMVSAQSTRLAHARMVSQVSIALC